MAYYPNKQNHAYAYNSDMVASDVGFETKDSYSIETHYSCDVATDELSYKAKVTKNWCYSEIPATGKLPNKKYREVLFIGSLAACHEFIAATIRLQGYWERDPNNSFNQIFIEPTIKAINNPNTPIE